MLAAHQERDPAPAPAARRAWTWTHRSPPRLQSAYRGRLSRRYDPPIGSGLRPYPPASLRYLGHATVLIELAGRRILTDPVLTDRVAFIRRAAASPDPDHQQAIDLVLISHGHLDHLHRASLEAVGRDVPTIVPRGMGAMVRRWGFRHVLVADPHGALRAGAADRDRHARRALRLQAAQWAARHGARLPDRGGGAPHLLRRRHRPVRRDGGDRAARLDAALLPVWGWGPRLGPGHMDPERAAAAAALRLRASPCRSTGARCGRWDALAAQPAGRSAAPFGRRGRATGARHPRRDRGAG